jgi:S-adenosylmethionine decarboxylase proenzyme
MDTRTRHLLAEYHGCDRAVLDDIARVEALMRLAAKAAGTTIVASVFHPFSPQGVSGVVVIEESHLSIHTWPEHGYAAVDFFTCGEGAPERAHEVIAAGLEAERSELLLLERGHYPGNTPSIRMRSHYSENHGAEDEAARAVTGADDRTK